MFYKKKISKYLVVIHEIKQVLRLDKPIYVRFSVLDLSKYWMCDFNYNYIQTKYKNNSVDLLFTDTDSSTYGIKTDDVYENFYKNKDFFYFNNYPKDLKFYHPSIMNEIIKMKDESEGRKTIEFVGLKSKNAFFDWCRW